MHTNQQMSWKSLYHRATALLSTSLSSTLDFVCLCCQGADLPYSPAALLSYYVTALIWHLGSLDKEQEGQFRAQKNTRQINAPRKIVDLMLSSLFPFCPSDFQRLLIGWYWGHTVTYIPFWKVIFEREKKGVRSVISFYKPSHCNRIKDFFFSLKEISLSCINCMPPRNSSSLPQDYSEWWYCHSATPPQ